MKKKQLSQSSLQRSCPEKITCVTGTAQKMKFSMDFFSKCDLIRRNLWILNGKLRFFCTEGTVLVRKIQPYTNQKCLRGWHKKLTTGKQMHEVPENYWIILTLLLLTLNIKEMLAICGCIYFLWAKEQKTWASPSVHLYIGFK